jgi:hypothetical protein
MSARPISPYPFHSSNAAAEKAKKAIRTILGIGAMFVAIAMALGALLSPSSAHLRLVPGAVACRTGQPFASEAASSPAAIKPPTFQPKTVPPSSKADMLSQAVKAVQEARGAGINRHVLRLFLPRDGELTPPDESWVGGIMQLYAVASPLARELLQKLGVEVAGVPPSLSEQRLDASGVDGESVWMAQSSKPENDAVGFVQPSTEQVDRMLQVSGNAGVRPVLLINPQWKERDDPLDALSRRAGLLGSLGNFLGGKAATEAKLLEQG